MAFIKVSTVDTSSRIYAASWKF